MNFWRKQTDRMEVKVKMQCKNTKQKHNSKLKRKSNKNHYECREWFFKERQISRKMAEIERNSLNSENKKETFKAEAK